MQFNQFACPLCFQKNIATIKVDKRGYPYFRCAGCGTTIFLRNKEAHKGLLFFSSLIEETSDDELRRWEDFMANKNLVQIAAVSLATRKQPVQTEVKK